MYLNCLLNKFAFKIIFMKCKNIVTFKLNPEKHDRFSLKKSELLNEKELEIPKKYKVSSFSPQNWLKKNIKRLKKRLQRL
jgi:hypothetical protein